MNSIVKKLTLVLILLCFDFQSCCAAARPSAPEEGEMSIPEAPPLLPEAAERKKKSEEKVAREVKGSESEIKARTLSRLLHDVIIILDNSEELTAADTTLPFAVSQFVLALCQQASPILVSGHTIQTFLKWWRLPDASTNTKLQPIKKWWTVSTDWDTYSVRDGSLVLFIPRTYKDAQLTYHSTPEFRKQLSEVKEYTTEEVILGFPIAGGSLQPIPFDVLTKKDITPEEDKQLAHRIARDSPVVIETLKNCFVNGNNSLFGFWNIVMAGHGMYGNLFFLSPSLKIVDEFDARGVTIAGLPLADFKKWITFISTKLNTNILYYTSCYAGDVNLHLPYTTTFINEKGVMRSNLTQAHFTIVSGALTDDLVWGSSIDSLVACINKTPVSMIQGSRDYKAFFDRMHYLSSIGDLPKRFTDQELVESITPLTVRHIDIAYKDPWGVTGLPMVKDPLSDTFRPLPLNKNIHVINNVAVQKKLKKKGTFTFYDAEVILIATPEVSVPVKIEYDYSIQKAPALVSLIPRESLIIFESLETSSTFSNFFIHTLGAVSYTKYFYFKKLTLVNDYNGDQDKSVGAHTVTLTDVFVVLDRKEPMISIMFTGHLGKKYYAKAFVPASITGNARLGTLLSFSLDKTDSTSSIGSMPFQSIIKDNDLVNALINYFAMNETGFEDHSSMLLWFMPNLSPSDKKMFKEGAIQGKKIVQEWEEKNKKQQELKEGEEKEKKKTAHAAVGE